MFADISDIEDRSDLQMDDSDGLKTITGVCLAMLALSLLINQYFPIPFDTTFLLGL